MSEPTTPTGRALRIGMADEFGVSLVAADKTILAIEREAAAAERENQARLARIGAAVEGLPDDWDLARGGLSQQWIVYGPDGRPRGHGPTIEAAIAAATGEDEA